MLLETGKEDALTHLALTKGEIKMNGASAAKLWIGLGYAIAKGWATYNGDSCFTITSAGLNALADLRHLKRS